MKEIVKVDLLRGIERLRKQLARVEDQIIGGHLPDKLNDVDAIDIVVRAIAKGTSQALEMVGVAVKDSNEQR